MTKNLTQAALPLDVPALGPPTSTTFSQPTAILGWSQEFSGQIILILTHRSSCTEIPTSPSRTACSPGAGGCCSRCQSSSCSGFPELTGGKKKAFKKQSERHRSGCCHQVTSSLCGCSARQNARDPPSPPRLRASPRSPALLPWMSPRVPSSPFPAAPHPQVNPGALTPP